MSLVAIHTSSIVVSVNERASSLLTESLSRSNAIPKDVGGATLVAVDMVDTIANTRLTAAWQKQPCVTSEWSQAGALSCSKICKGPLVSEHHPR
jgi:hypothetical protein